MTGLLPLEGRIPPNTGLNTAQLNKVKVIFKSKENLQIVNKMQRLVSPQTESIVTISKVQFKICLYAGLNPLIQKSISQYFVRACRSEDNSEGAEKA